MMNENKNKRKWSIITFFHSFWMHKSITTERSNNGFAQQIHEKKFCDENDKITKQRIVGWRKTLEIIPFFGMSQRLRWTCYFLLISVGKIEIFTFYSIVVKCSWSVTFCRFFAESFFQSLDISDPFSPFSHNNSFSLPDVPIELKYSNHIVVSPYFLYEALNFVISHTFQSCFQFALWSWFA